MAAAAAATPSNPDNNQHVTVAQIDPSHVVALTRLPIFFKAEVDFEDEGWLIASYSCTKDGIEGKGAGKGIGKDSSIVHVRMP